MGYWFKRETVPWSWHDMIAHMTPETRDVVVNGADGSSGGLLRCAVIRCPKSYDHKRCFAAKHGQGHGAARKGEHLENYDFVVFRQDGSALRFHPDWNGAKFDIYRIEPHQHQVRPPHQGCGRTWGPGTYRFYDGIGKETDGKFDSQRGNMLLPYRTGYP